MNKLSLFDITPPPKTLEEIHEKWKGCRKCFFSIGTPCLPNGSKTGKVLIVGQYPGQEDMRTGIPFSGPQGKVCRDYLKRANFVEAELFYTNILMCTCPMQPTKDVLDNCRDSLEELISVQGPELIVAMGSHAQKRVGIKEEVVGRVPQYKGIKVAVCVHPAAIARAKSREDKAKLIDQVVEDLARARRIYLGRD